MIVNPDGLAIIWILLAGLAALILFGAGAIGWALGRRVNSRERRRIQRPARLVQPRARVDPFVDLGTLSELLDRKDVLILSTLTTGTEVRAEVIETAIIDTTSTIKINYKTIPTQRNYNETTVAHRTKHDIKEQSWSIIYPEIVDLLQQSKLVIGYNAGLHRRMLSQTAERQGLKRLPPTDWGCLMRRYTEETTGYESPWIEIGSAAAREGIPMEQPPSAVDDAHVALQLLRTMARREENPGE